jgi:single-strand DNA-binding protein
MLNKSMVIGNLGSDPKVVKSQSGRAVASFTVATTERAYTTSDGQQIPERTEWHNIVCFGRIAEVVQKYLHKGSKVYVEGKMRTRQFEGKDGQKHYITEINAEGLEMLDTRPSGQQQQQARQQQTAAYSSSPSYQQQPQASSPQPSADTQEDLPF